MTAGCTEANSEKCQALMEKLTALQGTIHQYSDTAAVKVLGGKIQAHFIQLAKNGININNIEEFICKLAGKMALTSSHCFYCTFEI